MGHLRDRHVHEHPPPPLPAMLTRADLEATLLAELLRVTGPEDGSNFYDLVPEGSDEQLRAAIGHLRTLPDGIGYREMMRRLQEAPPE